MSIGELKVCAKCHLELPVSSFVITDKRTGRRKSQCRKCESARIKAYYDANPEYREKVKARTLAWQRANLKRTAANRRNSRLKWQYNLTTQQFNALLAAQNGKCALCQRAEHGRRGLDADSWMIDHNHETGEVRGLLCDSCNTSLGHFESLMRNVGIDAVHEYLTRPSPVPPQPSIGEVFVPRFVADIPSAATKPCPVEGCTEAAKWHGYCQDHYMEQFRAKVRELRPPTAQPERHARGEMQWRTQLTADQVRAIRASTAKGVDLAVQYNTTPSAISAIRTRRTWKHVP